MESGTKLDHKWIDATCTKAKHCAVCGKTDGNPRPHTPSTSGSGWTTCTHCGTKYCEHSYYSDKRQPCEIKGYWVQYCPFCGDEYRDEEMDQIDPLGTIHHNHQYPVVVDGKIYLRCTNPGCNHLADTYSMTTEEMPDYDQLTVQGLVDDGIDPALANQIANFMHINYNNNGGDPAAAMEYLESIRELDDTEWWTPELVYQCYSAKVAQNYGVLPNIPLIPSGY